MKLVGPVPARRVLGWALVLGCFAIFLFSSNRSMADSRFTLLLSDSLWHHHSFVLDRYFQGSGFRTSKNQQIQANQILQLKPEGGRLYYWYPPGSSILSIPFLVLLEAFGFRVTNESGDYDFPAEMAMQGLLAAFLMAVFAGTLYATGLYVLSPSQSALVAAGSVLGTQVWSTASRLLWAHTWELVLLGWMLWMLVRHASQGTRLRPILLGFLGASLYVVRPTGILPAAAIGLYLLIRAPRAGILYGLACSLGFAAFFGYSWYHFGTLRPSYYQLSPEFDLPTFWTGLQGTLISPSRGLLIYVPVLLFIAWALLRYRRALSHRGLAAMSLLILGTHTALICLWPIWWGGDSYGPRLSTCLVPWMAWLAMLSLQARGETLARTGQRRRLEAGLGFLLLALSALIHGAGAHREDVSIWNTRPLKLGFRPERLWDWKRPQFLAAWSWPLPYDYPDLRLGQTIHPGTLEDERFLWGGWDEKPGASRWTVEPTARVIFTWTGPQPSQVELKVQPFLVPGHIRRQRVQVALNDRYIGKFWLRRGNVQTLSLSFDPWLIQEKNTLRFRLLGIQSLADLAMEGDPLDRPGIALTSITFR